MSDSLLTSASGFDAPGLAPPPDGQPSARRGSGVAPSSAGMYRPDLDTRPFANKHSAGMGRMHLGELRVAQDSAVLGGERVRLDHDEDQDDQPLEADWLSDEEGMDEDTLAFLREFEAELEAGSGCAPSQGNSAVSVLNAPIERSAVATEKASDQQKPQPPTAAASGPVFRRRVILQRTSTVPVSLAHARSMAGSASRGLREARAYASNP